MFTPTPTPTGVRPARQTPDQARVNPWLLWRIEEPAGSDTLSVAELAECRCPDLCNRDHVNE